MVDVSKVHQSEVGPPIFFHHEHQRQIFPLLTKPYPLQDSLQSSGIQNRSTKSGVTTIIINTYSQLYKNLKPQHCFTNFHNQTEYHEVIAFVFRERNIRKVKIKRSNSLQEKKKQTQCSQQSMLMSSDKITSLYQSSTKRKRFATSTINKRPASSK